MESAACGHFETFVEQFELPKSGRSRKAIRYTGFGSANEAIMRAERWEPIGGIDGNCDNIEFTYSSDNTATVLMNFADSAGSARTLTLKFSHVVVLAGEDEAPGGFIPAPPIQSLPKLERGRYPSWTFPLLTLLDSSPLKQYQLMRGARLRLGHFFLVSSDNLVHVIASAEVNAAWR